MKAVRFDEYGDIDVLKVVELDPPVVGPGRVLVRVKAAGINPGEASIRRGLLAQRWPATFPSGEGSDLAGVVEELGEGVTGFAVGDEVLGWTDDRTSQAELVAAEASKLVHRPTNVPWEVAGALFVVGTTAYAAVRAVSLRAKTLWSSPRPRVASVRWPCRSLAVRGQRSSDWPARAIMPGSPATTCCP